MTNVAETRISGPGAKLLAALPVAFVAASVWGAYSWGRAQGKNDLFWAFLVMAGFVGVTFVILSYSSTKLAFPNGKGNGLAWLTNWQGLTIGDDRRFSTSKMMVVLWTLVFAAALTLLSVMVWVGRLTPDQAFGQEWSAYLLLLGGPFASAVLAKAITSSKSSEGEKTTASETSLGDVTSTDAGTPSLPDTQYTIFTLVAIFYFVGAFLTSIRAYAISTADCVADPAATGCTVALPEIPPALLGLTSLAALTYVGAKAVTKEAPRIVTILPERIAPHETATVTLINAPQDLKQGQVVVKFTMTSAPNTHYLMSPLTAPVPQGALTLFKVEGPPEVGTYNVVVTISGAETAPHTETVQY